MLSKQGLQGYLFRTTKHGTFKNHSLILNMPDSAEAVYSWHQHFLVSCGQKNDETILQRLISVLYRHVNKCFACKCPEEVYKT
jgi:hypothetical protein